MRPLVMIPGPIEIDEVVVRALGQPPKSHLDPDFIETFGRALDRLKEVFFAPNGQPFVVAGSGTLAMEMAVANLIEPRDRAVVVDIGYFGTRMATILERHGALVTRVKAQPGHVPSTADVAAALDSAATKLLAITHVDTSTAARANVAELARLGKERGALVVVDGVCSIGAEELRQEEWNVDIALTASQKAIGAPPGLAILVASERAIEAWHGRKAPVASLYADFAEWLPIMSAYVARKPMYFATPPVNLIEALDASLGALLAEGMHARFRTHEKTARVFRAAWKALDLQPLCAREEDSANTLSALFYPKGIGPTLVGAVRAEGVVIAGGLHAELGPKYFRVGHMGLCRPSDVLATVGAIERALAKLGYAPRPVGVGVAAAEAALMTENG